MLTLESLHRRTIERAKIPALVFVAKRWAPDQSIIPWQAIHSGETFGEVSVVANHGTWQTDCPMFGCPGSSLASENDHRFVCLTCGFGPVRAVWPDERERIEAALDVRPIENRNWTPDDDIEGEEILSAGWLMVKGLT